jgi:hypothetical protein
MQVTNKRKHLEEGIMKSPNTKNAYWQFGINYFAQNGQSEEGNLKIRVDLTGYIRCME